MALGSRRRAGAKPLFGRVDPYCWFAVLGLVAIAGVGVVARSVVMTIIFLVLAAGLVTFDAWVNRPEPTRRPGPPPVASPRGRRPESLGPQDRSRAAPPRPAVPRPPQRFAAPPPRGERLQRPQRPRRMPDGR
ncbi:MULTISPECIES: hypothetical protein [unclassified Amycolatopsis]|uniref:hypothetical protein n=1 Tax=unclassified Amycolatopsis TaxID=2618356 RepID=UPI000C712076|nr:MULTISPECIES: hypothetical protein [unclassified Amycolatopsis]MCG3751126.1 hypothetical protein [Amycolatopsis sp. Poz14]